MKALLVNGPRNGHTMEIPEAVEEIHCAPPMKVRSVYVDPNGDTITQSVSDWKVGPSVYRLVGVLGDLATYKHKP